MTFNHVQAAHCETGVISSLLTHNGLQMNEPMAFGLGNGIAFAYLPFIKVAGQPLIAYRLPPKAIIKSLAARLGVKIRFQKFNDMVAGAHALQDAVDAGKLVGLQTSVFWLPYFPEEMRFHFNAHNLLVYGREGSQYKISDPVFEQPVSVEQKHLNKARFAKGALAPNGLMYTIEQAPAEIDYERLIPQAIKKAVRVMTGAPLPTIGVNGIQHLAKKIRRLDKKLDSKGQRLFLGHIVRMQEEIGTGGAGFRFMYASFLEQAGEKIDDAALKELSREMTTVGDSWRKFALYAVQQGKSQKVNLALLADTLFASAQSEKNIWAELKAWVKAK